MAKRQGRRDPEMRFSALVGPTRLPSEDRWDAIDQRAVGDALGGHGLAPSDLGRAARTGWVTSAQTPSEPVVFVGSAQCDLVDLAMSDTLPSDPIELRAMIASLTAQNARMTVSARLAPRLRRRGPALREGSSSTAVARRAD